MDPEDQMLLCLPAYKGLTASTEAELAGFFIFCFFVLHSLSRGSFMSESRGSLGPESPGEDLLALGL